MRLNSSFTQQPLNSSVQIESAFYDKAPNSGLPAVDIVLQRSVASRRASQGQDWGLALVTMSSPHRVFTAIPIANSSPNRRCRASVLYDDPTYNTCCTGHLRYPAGSLVLDVTWTPLRSSTNAWTIPNQSSSTVKSQSVADFSGKGGISSFSSFALTTHRRGLFCYRKR